jgi:hypothetical protein
LEQKINPDDSFNHSFASLPVFFLEFGLCSGTFSQFLHHLDPEPRFFVWLLWDFPHFLV